MKAKKIFNHGLRLEILFLLIISLAYFFLNLHDIDSWYYSAIGDEYAFFSYSKQIASGEVKLSLWPTTNSVSILDQRGVYGVVPVATSVYQALVMKVFGSTHRGWLISSILVVVISFWPLYFGVKELLDRKIAAWALIIMASSHYLWAWSHTGYWNIQAIFPAILAFFLFTQANKRQKTILWLLTGIASGLAFYIHYYPGITVIIIGLYLITNRKKLPQINLAAYFLGFFFVFLPYLYLNYQVATEVISQRTLVNSQEIPYQQRLFYFVRNFFSSFLVIYQNSHVDHYVSGSLLDPISAILFSIGLLFVLIKWRRFIYITITLILLLVMLGGFSQYTYVPTSRLYFMVPLMALFASLCLDNLFRILKNKLSAQAALITIMLVLTIILVLNLYRFYWQTPRKMPLTNEALIIGAIKSFPACKEEAIVIFQFPEPVLKPALESYDLADKVKFIKEEGELAKIKLTPNICLIAVQAKENLAREYLTKVKKDWETSHFSSPSGNKKIWLFFPHR